MTRQIAVRLEQDLGLALDAAAKRLRRRRSDIVRAALRAYLGSPDESELLLLVSRGAGRLDAIRHLIGAFATGDPDRGRRHRAHLRKRLTHARGMSS